MRRFHLRHLPLERLVLLHKPAKTLSGNVVLFFQIENFLAEKIGSKVQGEAIRGVVVLEVVILLGINARESEMENGTASNIDTRSLPRCSHPLSPTPWKQRPR